VPERRHRPDVSWCRHAVRITSNRRGVFHRRERLRERTTLFSYAAPAAFDGMPDGMAGSGLPFLPIPWQRAVRRLRRTDCRVATDNQGEEITS
jgi:hypothetical protein